MGRADCTCFVLYILAHALSPVWPEAVLAVESKQFVRVAEDQKQPSATEEGKQLREPNSAPSRASVKESQTPAPDNTPKPSRFMPQCGLYCLYAAMKISGKGVDYAGLVKSDYLSSNRGSSLLELRQAAEDHGMYTIPAARLTVRDLRRSPYLILLHVKSAPQATTYDHYQLFVDCRAGKARVIDPPTSMSLIRFEDITPWWDGNGLILSAQPIDAGFVYVPRYMQMVVSGAIGAFIILGGYFAKRRFTSTGRVPLGWSLARSGGQVAGFAAVAFVLGFFHQFVSDAGFLVHPSAVRSLQEAHAADFIPKISRGKAARLLGNGTVFIDARLTPDYQVDHLEGAISVPVDANDVVRRERVKKIPLNTPIVVYCQSASCKFAEKVAIQLVDDGFSQVSIFRGGWMEWVSKHKDGVAGRTPEGSNATDDHA